MEELKKRRFTPVRPAYTRSPHLPKMWICNIHKHHREVVTVHADSPDSMTINFECYCVECVEIDENLYRYGRPVSVASVPEKKLKEEFVGIWFTQKGYAEYKKELESR